jgi:D-serine deaminase-like pyridoxal phosphate-dependent protein
VSAVPRLQELETPAAVVDLDRMEANLQRVAAYTREHGFSWRPHAKTHKIPELGARQLAAGACGLTVATPREAEVMASVAEDILLAYPPVGETKIQRVLALPEVVRLSVAMDSLEALVPLARAAQERRRRVGVLVEVDVGMGRVGLPEPPQAVEIAVRVADLPGVELDGLLFFPGHVREPLGRQGPALAAVSRRLAGFLEALEGAGIAPRVVSGGSTPTLWRCHEMTGLTEVRPGTNLFNDRTTALFEACGWEDCAYSVLATVVSTAVPGQVVVDAGSKALAREEIGGGIAGFGSVLDRPEVVVTGLSEEHGTLGLEATDWRPQVGERVRLVPNHVCVSVNLQERLWGVRDDEVVECWEVAARGR